MFKDNDVLEKEKQFKHIIVCVYTVYIRVCIYRVSNQLQKKQDLFSFVFDK